MNIIQVCGSEMQRKDIIGRTEINFNDRWKFLKLTQKNGLSDLVIESEDFDDSLWENISLPHTWNAADGASGRTGIEEGGENYYRGLGGYRKKTYISEKEYGSRLIFIEFEGANTVTELFVNGFFAGRHEGGYSAFRFDITPYIIPDKENLFAVKVNNAPTNYIPPITDQGDFTKMGGIYRDVKLIAVEKIHIDLADHGASGVYVTPKNITKDSAEIDILVKLANDGAEETELIVKTNILNAEGKLTAAESKSLSLAASEKNHVRFNVTVEDPILWNGKKNPYLYTAEIIVESQSGELDRYKQSFGIRSYRFDPENGFFLNGEYLDLRGVNYHQDSYENGWAMTDEQRERDYGTMLEMGCTSVRMAHYQHDGYEYELCDRLGITVWTEIGIVNKMSADETERHAIAEGFSDNAKQQLTELIRQNYNHPSIIVWGITNELHQMTDEIYEIYSELCEMAHREDGTRPITFADDQFWGRFTELPTDVMGCNRYFGWYKDAGAVEKFGPWLDSYHESKKTQPVCVSEYGGGAALSQFKENIDWLSDIDPWGERHYQNYQSAMHEKIWAQFHQRKYLWGKYIWCMFDFASDGRMEGDTIGQNDKGLATRERVPKDSFYFYKSVWNSEPMLHLTEKGFKRRDRIVSEIKAYSNAESVELFINDISKGIINRSELTLEFSTVFSWKNIEIAADIENEVLVKANFSDGKVLEDKAVWIQEITNNN